MGIREFRNLCPGGQLTGDKKTLRRNSPQIFKINPDWTEQVGISTLGNRSGFKVQGFGFDVKSELLMFELCRIILKGRFVSGFTATQP